MIRYEFYDFQVTDSNIHPNDIFENEKELANQFIAKNQLAGNSSDYLFKSNNIPYVWDHNKNLVAKINITPELHDQYFRMSELSKFRASTEYQENVRSLRKHIWNSYVDWIEGRCFRYLDQKSELKVLDIGSRNIGWVEEIQKSKHFKNLHLKNTLPPITCENDIFNEYNLIIALDVIQRELNPSKFLSDIKDSLSGDGIAVISFRSGTGFDILALKENNTSIFPPDHLFLPSIKGIQHLLEEAGLTAKEITTPGQLDAEIIKKSVDNKTCTDPLMVHLVETVPLQELQSFIQKNNLSSHVRVVAKKK